MTKEEYQEIDKIVMGLVVEKLMIKLNSKPIQHKEPKITLKNTIDFAENGHKDPFFYNVVKRNFELTFGWDESQFTKEIYAKFFQSHLKPTIYEALERIIIS
jgi:hypothetical protein